MMLGLSLEGSRVSLLYNNSLLTAIMNQNVRWRLMDQNFPNSACRPPATSDSVVWGVFQEQLDDSLLMANAFPLNSHLSVEDLISSCAQITADFTQPLRGAGDPLTSDLAARVLSARLLVV